MSDLGIIDIKFDGNKSPTVSLHALGKTVEKFFSTTLQIIKSYRVECPG